MSVKCHQLGDFNGNYLKFEGVAAKNKLLQSVFNKNTSSSNIEPAILDQLEKQQNDRFYDFDQYRIHSNLQTAFIADTKVYRQNLPSESLRY